jgi:carbonic anhydrase/acetyltransferase-like protein (isoleucine patch superfamily)
LIGINAVVLDNVWIKPFTLVGAGSIVPPGKILDGGLWIGSPARKVRDLTDDETQMLTDNAVNYVELLEVWKSKLQTN